MTPVSLDMGYTYLLDTSVLSQPLKDQPLRSVQRRWTPERTAGFCTSAVCYAELLRGLEERNSRKLWQRYELYLSDEITVLPFDALCAVAFSRFCAWLKAKGERREMADLLIAATAVAHDLPLATLNVRHFTGVDGLVVDDWSS